MLSILLNTSDKTRIVTKISTIELSIIILFIKSVLNLNNRKVQEV